MSVTRRKAVHGWRWVIYRHDESLENPAPIFRAYSEQRCLTDSGKVYYRKNKYKDFPIGQRKEMLAFLEEVTPAEFAGAIYCVECGAATELDCICDDLNDDQYPCSPSNEI